MYKKLTILCVILLSSMMAMAQKKDDILGKWINPTAEGQIEIYKRGEKYFGRLAWIKEPNDEKGKPKLDTKNPAPNLRSRPLLGLEILKDFVFDDDEWNDGTIYDPNTGKTYSCKLTVKPNGQLSIRGYVGISLIGRSEIWKRVK